MNDFDKNMADIFDVSPVSDPINDTGKKTTLLPVASDKDEGPDTKQDLVDAYEQSKNNLQDFIEQGKDAMEEILQVAKAGQHPRAFEVFGGLLKNMVDANDKLLDIQKKMREMDGKKKDSGGTNIDKAIFVGSTAELSKFIKGKNES